MHRYIKQFLQNGHKNKNNDATVLFKAKVTDGIHFYDFKNKHTFVCLSMCG